MVFFFFLFRGGESGLAIVLAFLNWMQWVEQCGVEELIFFRMRLGEILGN